MGKGDMLMLQPGMTGLTRGQGTFVRDDEIHRVTAELENWPPPRFSPELTGQPDGSADEAQPQEQLDELFDQAVETVLDAQRGSASLLRRRLKVPASRAGAIIDQMVQVGILGEPRGSRGRECLITLDEWRKILEGGGH